MPASSGRGRAGTITSLTTQQQPAAERPAGCSRAKSSGLNPLPRTAPRPARRPGRAPPWCWWSAPGRCGQASSSTEASSTTSACRASVESRPPVMAMIGTPRRLSAASEPEQLVGLAALGEQDRHVVAAHDAQVAVHAVHRVQEARRGAGRGQRRGDLAGDHARLADAGDDDPAPARSQELHRLGEAAVEPLARAAATACRLQPEHPAAALQPARSASAGRDIAALAEVACATHLVPFAAGPSSASANSRTAPCPPAAAVVKRPASLTSWHGVGHGDRAAPTRRRSGRSGEVVADEARLLPGEAVPAREDRLERGQLARRRRPATNSSTCELLGAQPRGVADSRPVTTPPTRPGCRAAGRTPSPSWMSNRLSSTRWPPSAPM